MDDDFFLWLHSPEGQMSEHALFEVMDYLEGAIVDPQERLIIWKDGKPRSIDQTVRRIRRLSKLPSSHIESHVTGWLEMQYEPEGLTERQMDKFDTMIDAWIRDHNISHGRDPDFV